MRPRFRSLFFSAVLIVASGCVSTNATRLGDGLTRPPVPSSSVAIYRMASQVPGRYEEVALLNSKGESGFTNEAGMFNSMRKKAGELGANAIILDALSEPSAAVKVASAFLGTGSERKGRAIAVFVFPNTVANP